MSPLMDEALMLIFDVGVEVVTSIGELVEMCSPQILSGWRPLFSALRTVHSSRRDTRDHLLGGFSTGTSPASINFHLLPSASISFHLLSSVSFLHLCSAGRTQAPVFDVFEAFITTDNIQVFANAATDYILCLMKLVRGLGGCGLHQLWRSDEGCLCWL